MRGLKKKCVCGVGGMSSIQFYFGFLVGIFTSQSLLAGACFQGVGKPLKWSITTTQSMAGVWK